MSQGNDSLPTAVLTAKKRDLQPLLEESTQLLELDPQQVVDMESYLRRAWFFGVKTGHKVLAEKAVGETDAMSVLLSLQDEFRELIEGCAEALNMTIGATLAAWNYLGEAWLAGARFCEVEIAARMIEWKTGGLDENLDWLEDA